MHHKLILPVFSLFISFSLFSQNLPRNPEIRRNPQVQFDHFSTNSGLSDREVISIYQDRYGYIWFGTVDGLNKFDGYSFQVFHHIPGDSLSLSSDMIECIAEDIAGELWIGTPEGLNKYNREKNSFQRYPTVQPDSSSTPANHIRALFTASDSVLWIETFDGTLHAMDLVTGQLFHYPHQAPNQPEYHYHTIYEDRTGRLWIGGRGLGLLYFDRSKKQFHFIEADELSPTGKREQDVGAYLEDSYGNFWVSGLDGIYLFDTEKEEFNKLLSTTTWSMTEDRKGNVWFGTGHGLFQFNPRTDELIQFTAEPDNPFSISSNEINKVFADRQGTIWIGTANGIDRIAHKAYPFEHYRHVPGNKNTISSNRVSAVLEDHLGYIWIATMGEGLNRLDPKTKEITCYRHDPKDQKSLGSDKVSCLYEDKQGRLWIGLWAGIGFQQLDRKSSTFLTWRINPTNLKEDWYNDFAEDSLGNFYLGFWGGPGLTLFDRERGRFLGGLKEKFSPQESSRLINDLFTDSKGVLWMGTSTVGLQRYDPCTGATMHYGFEEGDSSGLLGQVVNSILEDSSGMIWIGGTGISRLNPKTNEFTHYTQRNGLANDAVMGMELDHNGNLWISTRNGLSKFDPFTESFQNFFMDHGLQENSFSRAHTKLKSGILIFGGINGFNLFHPDSIATHRDTSRPVIKDFRIFDDLRQADLCVTEQIDLFYDENFFSFEFAAPASINPAGLSFVYRLKPLERDWHHTDASNRRATYTSVPSGTYTFETGIIYDGETEPANVASVKVKVNPPFWKTWWFISLEILVSLGLITLVFRIRVHQLKLKSRALELKQKLLRSQMNPHFIFNSLFSIQNYIYEQKADQAGRYLSDFAHLIRLILNNSREEFISLEKEIETIQLYLELQLLRFNHNFKFTLTIDPEIDTELTAVPPMLAQPFIENALEHGLRHKGGMGQIWISFSLNFEMIRFEVIDDGIGLAKAIEMKNREQKKHKSLALEITHERIAHLNRELSRKIRFELADRYNKDGESEGTIVRFSIPYMDYIPQGNFHTNE